MLLALLLYVLYGGLLFFMLGTLFPKLNIQELSFVSQSQIFHLLINNPLNLLMKLPEYALFKFHLRGIAEIRSVSVIYLLAYTALFFYIVKSRNSNRIAFFSTLLFASSTWLLISARSATPNILYLSPLLVIATVTIFKQIPQKKLSAFLLITLVGLLLYIPGMIWFLFFVAIWSREQVKDFVKKIPDWLIVLGLFWAMILLLPLIYALMHSTIDLAQFIGLPEKLPTITTYFGNLLRVPMHLFLRGPFAPGEWIGRLPILDVFSSFMFVLGIYVCWLNWTLEYSKMLIGALGFSVLLIGLGGVFDITMILPFVYLIISLGLAFFLQQWFTVFPRNPIARGLGLATIIVIVSVTLIYHLSRYYIALPHTTSNISSQVISLNKE
jgi:hypothetical protein